MNQKPIKLISYAKAGTDNTLESPYLEYLEQYAIDTTINENIDKLTKIYEHLRYLLAQQGVSHYPPKIEHYKDRQVSVLKINEFDPLLRIAFYTIEQDAEIIILLLNVIEKPKHYSGALKQRVDADIQLFLDLAEQNLADFLTTGQGIDITAEYL
jgi:hypothetical protein